MSSPPQTVVKKEGVWTVDGPPNPSIPTNLLSRPRETVKLISHHHPSNIPGKSLITLLVTLPPNAATPPHTHGGAAVLALMVRGKSRNQMNDGEAFVSGEGETFYEAPGCHHVRGENALEGEETQFYAVFIVDDEHFEREGLGGILKLDAEVEENGG
ncbi:MAG: hypothetical protein Q9184_002488 [Pyrenodesmia sp. 2 TL-2023]